jgi:pimeloyl-ACP methyl ester carboxylesterase
MERWILYHTYSGYEAAMAWYDRAWERLTVPVESFMLSTRFGETHVISAGPPDAPAVALIQGLGGNAMLWEPQIADLAVSYRVYAIDVVGQTGRSAPTRPSYRDTSYSLWLTDVLDALGVERISLVGLSMGGRLAMQFTGFTPQRIHRLALLSSIGIGMQSFRFIRRALPIGLQLGRPADERLRRLIQAIVGVPGRTLDERVSEAMFLLLKHFRFGTGPREVLDGLSLLFALPSEDLQRLSAPTLLLMGEYEVLFNPQTVLERARRLMPGLVAAEIVPNAGHVMNYDQPAWVNDRLMLFLSDAGV